MSELEIKGLSEEEVEGVSGGRIDRAYKTTKKGKVKKDGFKAYSDKTGEYVGHFKSYTGAERAVMQHDNMVQVDGLANKKIK